MSKETTHIKSRSINRLQHLLVTNKVRNPKMIAVLVFISLSLLSHFLAYQNYLLAESKLQDKMHEELIRVKDKLNTFLKSSLIATKTLSYIVENYGIPEDFEKIGKHLIGENKNIDVIELTQGGLITHVYPKEGNENVINYDIIKEPTTRKEALRAIQTRELFFAGPFKLKQGGHGIVGRNAIFKEGKFWGFSVVVLRLNTLVKSLGLDSSSHKNLVFQLSKTNPNTGKEEFFLANTIQQSGKHSQSIFIPEGKWKIYIHNTSNKNGLNLLILSVFGLFVSALIAFFTYYFVQQPEILKELVDEKTEQIKATEKILTDSLNRIKESFISLNNNWEYTFINTSALQTHPEGIEKIIGKSIWEVHPELLGTDFEHTYKNAMLKQESGEIESFYAPMGLYFSGRFYPSNDGITIIYSDITERKKLENELYETYQNIRNLNNYLQTVREEERGNIAREIHDELGQQLTALKMDAYWLSKKISAEDNPIQDKLNQMLSLIDQTIQTVRRIASELRPGILDDLGLVAALDWLSSETMKRSGINISFHSNIEDVKLDKIHAIGVFRIYQEALTNVLRYAHSKVVKASLLHEGNTIILSVTDNGIGFSQEDIKSKKSFGLSSMKERALMMQGQLDIQSEPQKGTTIRLILPDSIILLT
ncbi:MAG: histidine kinase [Bacteroidia bacterium]|nr:histidine kinase [Bacteroidia bacterium]